MDGHHVDAGGDRGDFGLTLVCRVLQILAASRLARSFPRGDGRSELQRMRHPRLPKRHHHSLARTLRILHRADPLSGADSRSSPT